MSGVPPLTSQRTLVPGPVVRQGTERPYRVLTTGPGEPHLVRGELTEDVSGEPGVRGRPVIAFAHVTDLQLADVQSPGRFEFCERYAEDPRFQLLVPMHRPQEALTGRAADAMVRTLNGLTHGPVTGAELALVVTTGDAIDNAQWNELQLLLALLEGGTARPGSGGDRYEGVQSLAWGDETFWRPDGVAGGRPDLMRTRHGFPHLPGVLDAALAEFDTPGLRLPWLACLGNHELLVQGVGLVTQPLREALVGGQKATGPLAELDVESLHELFVERPESLLVGDRRQVTADPDRRAVGRQEFVEAHFSARGRPHGHGFTAGNVRSGTAYYVYDVGEVRFICLDTTSAAGAADGCVDEEQARWLEQRLAEVHSRHVGGDGRVVVTRHEDRLVVLLSHHGIDSLTNSRGTGAGGSGAGGSGAGGSGAAWDGRAVRELVHRFGNVVGWLNGHTHRNRVTPRPDPSGHTGGFWEITTSALVDWPCQARLVEIARNDDGTVSLICTMVDHNGLVGPEGGRAMTGRWLAGVHRELAANEPWRGVAGPTRPAGTRGDRNVELRLPTRLGGHSVPG